MALIAEDLSRANMVFFHIKELNSNGATFQPLADHITNKNRPNDEYDNIMSYQSLMCY